MGVVCANFAVGQPAEVCMHLILQMVG